MEIKLNIEKSQRKALAQKISEITGEEVKYLGVPSCAYEIGIFTVTKDAVLTCADDSNNDTVKMILEWLSEAGYTAENEPEENGKDSVFPVHTGISVPLAQHIVILLEIDMKM
jgi:predicted ArsR family transcriptional regulator